MTRPEIRQIIITLGACAVTAACVLWYVHSSEKKIAVVDAIRIVNSFKMKQELEARAEGPLKYLARQADSLKGALSAKSKVQGVPREELETLYKAFARAQGALEQEYQQSNQSINEQVWKRLNPLIDEYGKQHKLRLIIGANGMGNVLYNDDYYDRTREVTDFVNKRYEEGN